MNTPWLPPLTREGHRQLAAFFEQWERILSGPHSAEPVKLDGLAEARASRMYFDDDNPPLLRLYDVRDFTSSDSGWGVSVERLVEETLYRKDRVWTIDHYTVEELDGILAASGNALMHRRIEALLSTLRRLGPAPESNEPVDVGEPLAGWSMSLYPIGDLQRAVEGPPKKQVEFDDLWYFTRGNSGFAAGYGFPEGRADSVAETLEPRTGFGIAQERANLPGFAVAGDLVLYDARPEMHGQFLDCLTNLRRALLKGEPLEPAFLGPADKPAWHTVYDLRPALAHYPELDERQLAEVVLACIWNNPGLSLISREELQSVPLRTLPGLLVHGPTFSTVAVDSVFQMLLHNAADLPRPYELAQDDLQSTIKRLARAVSTEQDVLRLRYVLWLASQVNQPAPELVTAVIGRLQIASAESDPMLYLLLCRLTGSFGPAAKAAVPLIAARLAVSDEWYEHRGLLAVLMDLGVTGELALIRLAATPRAGEPSLQIHLPRPASPELLPDVLKLFSDPSFNADVLRRVCLSLARDTRVVARLLEEWQRSPDAELRSRAAAIIKVAPEFDPKRQP